MAESSAPSSGLRWLRRCAIGFVLVLGLLIGGGLSLRGCLLQIGSRRLAEFESRTDKEDPGWRWDDVIKDREEIPEAENAASRILTAGKLLPKGWPNKSAVATQKTVIPKDPLEMRLKRIEPNRRLDETLLADLKAELKDLTPAVEESRKVADFPRGRFEIAWGPVPYSTLLPHIDPLRNVGTLLSWNVALRVEQKDFTGAIRSLRALWNTGQSIGDEPVLISQLVRMALVSRSLEAMERLLGQGSIGDKDLAGFARVFEKEEEASPGLLYKSSRFERAAMGRALEMAAKGEINLHQLFGSGSQSLFERAMDWPLMQPLARYGEGPSLELMTRYLKTLSLSAMKRREALNSFDQELRQMKANIHKNPEMIPAILLIPAISRVTEAFDREQAFIGCTAVALGVERYRLRHNSWPDDLARLVPDLIAKIPEDPFSGASLHYRKLPDGVVVYSVGPDGVDNGGVLNRDNPTKKDTDLGFRLWDKEKRGLSPTPQEAMGK